MPDTAHDQISHEGDYEMHDIDYEVNCDVLVIGGAGAAVMSAVSAAKKGAAVTVVTKGKIGKSGNTIMIGGGFCIDGESAFHECGLKDANRSFSKDQLFNKLVTSSFFIGNQKIQKQYVDKGPRAVKECLGWANSANQKFQYIPQGVSWRTSGKAFGRTVKEGIRLNPQIQVFEDTLIVDILLSGKKACGAVGLNIYTGEIVQYNAKSVLIATGGFQPFSLKNSISDMTGDGIAMALRAGAKSVDMEFFLFIPTITEPTYARGSILPYLLTIPAINPVFPKVTDLDGNELNIPPEFKTIPKGDKIYKIIYSYFWGKGIFEKYDTYGNNFYYDYSDYTDDEIYRIFDDVAENEAPWHAKGKYNKIDLHKLAEDIIRNQKRLQVGLGNEYSMGGIVVNDDLSTGVEGLYAAGEVTGGTFGAFRSGDGLVEMLAQGVTAGENAAAYANGSSMLKADNTEAVLSELFAPLNRSDGTSAIETLKKMEDIADKGLNFFRKQETLQEAEENITVLRKELQNLSVSNKDRKYNLEWYNSIIAKNIALCEEIAIHAAANRKESRGCHMRFDYPEIDNKNFLYNNYAQLVNDEIVYSTEKPQAAYQVLPTENFESIPKYIFEQYGGKVIENFSVKKPAAEKAGRI